MPESAASLDLAADPDVTPARPPISILGVRRRYWEITHGWTVPTSPQDNPAIDAPGRVA
jgi:hypothetical protein